MSSHAEELNFCSTAIDLCPTTTGILVKCLLYKYIKKGGKDGAFIIIELHIQQMLILWHFSGPISHNAR